VELEDSKQKMTHFDALTQEEIDFDTVKYPPLGSEIQDEIVQKYRLLGERIKAENLYQCNYVEYLIDFARWTALFATSMYLLHKGWYATSATFLGLFWHQLVFSAHDAGHMGITHNFHVDTVIGILLADFMGGLSLGWWKRNHNVHHIVTNSPEHDPDIQHIPFFAVSHRFLDSLRSTYYDRVMTYDIVAKSAVRLQHYLYYIVLLFGRFNLYRLSWEYLLGGQAPRKGPAWWHTYLELAGQAFFWTWFGYGILYSSIPTARDRILFVLISHMVTMPVHVQITLSHFAMSTADLGVHESFPQKMLRTTMDVDCPQWLDFLHGGLQFQVIHHLYPRIPRHNLRRTQKLVQVYCDEVKIPYALYGFVDGNKQVIGRLAEVARQAAILAECQRVMVEKGEFGAH
jgi:delta8-fatty-acid desaturase